MLSLNELFFVVHDTLQEQLRIRYSLEEVTQYIFSIMSFTKKVKKQIITHKLHLWLALKNNKDHCNKGRLVPINSLVLNFKVA